MKNNDNERPSVEVNVGSFWLALAIIIVGMMAFGYDCDDCGNCRRGGSQYQVKP